MEVEVTWNRVLHVWWACLWRNLFAVAVSLFAGTVAAAVLGVLLMDAGVSTDTTSLLSLLPVALSCVTLSLMSTRQILEKDYGEFRITLQSTGADVSRNA